MIDQILDEVLEILIANFPEGKLNLMKLALTVSASESFDRIFSSFVNFYDFYLNHDAPNYYVSNYYVPNYQSSRL